MFVPDHELMPILRAALERGQRVRMTVNGRSMFPFIRDGDVVEIAPAPPKPTLSSVVLAQLPDGRYPLHRLVAQRGAAWLLRGDNNSAPDGVVPHENLLAVVTRVERNGRVVRLALGRSGQWIGWLSGHGWLLPVARALYFPQSAAWAFLRGLQRLPVFRAWVKRFRPGYSIQQATVSDLVTVYPWLDPTGDCMRNWMEQNTAPYVTGYVARQGEEILGFVRLVRSLEVDMKPAGYWLYTLQVRSRYRGMGIGLALTQRVIDQARLEGASELSLEVLENNAPAIALYRKLGFDRVRSPAIDAELAADVQKYGRQRVLLRKGLA
jgi:ribosomal protein S18 acetylase RimI-like enzyme